MPLEGLWHRKDGHGRGVHRPCRGTTIGEEDPSGACEVNALPILPPRPLRLSVTSDIAVLQAKCLANGLFFIPGSGKEDRDGVKSAAASDIDIAR